MAFLYFAADPSRDRVAIGCTDDLEKKRRALARCDRDVELQRVVDSHVASVAARYLQHLYTSRRLVSDDGEFWFAISLLEIEHAVGLWDAKVLEQEEMMRELDRLKRQRSSKCFLAPNEADVQAVEHLRRIVEQIRCLQFERDFLESDLKLRIGTHAGLEGIAKWQAQESRRFDATAFRDEHPELYESFRKPTITRYFRLV